MMPDSIRDVEAQAVQPIAASTAAAPSASADIEVDSEVRVSMDSSLEVLE